MNDESIVSVRLKVIQRHLMVNRCFFCGNKPK